MSVSKSNTTIAKGLRINWFLHLIHIWYTVHSNAWQALFLALHFMRSHIYAVKVLDIQRITALIEKKTANHRNTSNMQNVCSIVAFLFIAHYQVNQNNMSKKGPVEVTDIKSFRPR